MAGPAAFLPTVNGPIQFAVDRQVGPLVGMPCSESLVNVNAQSRRLAGMHEPILEGIGVRKDGVRFRRVTHILLNSKIVNAEIKMQRSRHAHRAEIRGAVRSRADVVHLRQAGDFS